MGEMLAVVRREAKCVDVIDKIIGISDPRSRPPKALCPFHDDTHPSLYCYPNKYRCFVCHSTGDSIQFVQNYFRIDFKQALQYLYYEFLKYPRGKEGAAELGALRVVPTVIPQMIEHYPTLDERIEKCETALPFRDFAVFLIADRIGPDLRDTLVFDAKIVGPHGKDPLLWLCDYFGISPDEKIEAVRIWEEWARRSWLYQKNLSWARGRRAIEHGATIARKITSNS